MTPCKNWGPYVSDAAARRDKVPEIRCRKQNCAVLAQISPSLIMQMRRINFKPVAATIHGLNGLQISDSLKAKLLQHFDTEAVRPSAKHRVSLLWSNSL